MISILNRALFWTEALKRLNVHGGRSISYGINKFFNLHLWFHFLKKTYFCTGNKMNQGSEKRSLLLNRNRVRVWKPWKHTPPYSNFPYLPLPPPNVTTRRHPSPQRPRWKKRHEQQFIAYTFNNCSEPQDMKAKLFYSCQRLVSEEVVCLCSHKFLRNR